MSYRWPSASTSDLRASRWIGRFAAAVALVAAAAACSRAAPEAAKPAVAAAPVSAGPEFNHKFHLSRGVTCLDCHEGADKADKAPMPTIESCADCHEEIDEKKPAEKKATAFVDPATKKAKWHWFTKQSDEVKFSHAAHAKKKVECVECHKAVEESTRTGPELALTMDTCTTCHTAKKASNACDTCHTQIGLDRPPPSHDKLWNVRHGQAVRRGGVPQSRLEDCAMCHTEQTCIECHRREAPRDHTQFWRANAGHGLAAALDRQRCQACHTTDACVECHTTNPPRNHRGSWGAPRSRHCLGCHEKPAAAGGEGCFTCHDGTPSHLKAPAKPKGHRADDQCLLCHDRLRHPVNDQNCNECHR